MKLLLAQREGPYQLISLALSSVLWILHLPLSNCSNSFALSLRGVTRTKTSEAADGENCRCGSGEAGRRTGEGLQTLHLPFKGQCGTWCFSSEIHLSLSASAEIGIISTSGNFGIIYLFIYRRWVDLENEIQLPFVMWFFCGILHF